MTQQPIHRKDTIKLGNDPATGCTYEVLEGCGVIALDPRGTLASDVSNAQAYSVIVPPLVFNTWYTKCREYKWFQPPKSLLYDSWRSLMTAQYKALEDVAAIVIKCL